MEFYGLIGCNLEHSISPQIHNKIFSLTKREAAYKSFDVEKDDVGLVISAIKTLAVSGANVAMPYKELALYLCDSLDESAQKTLSVNTLVNKDGLIKGYNTGYYGFGKLYEEVCPENLKTAVILGNGGSAKTAVHYLHDIGMKKITVVSRRIEDSPFSNTRIIPYDFLPDVKADVVINTTPLGMMPNIYDCVLEEYLFANFRYAIDIVYNPYETEFVKRAKRQGLVCASGMTMLIWQSLRAQEIWQGRTFNDELFEQIKKFAYGLL